MEASRTVRVMVDGHVHLHGCFDIAAALDAAVGNFDRNRSALGLAADTPAWLWLVEHAEEGSWDRLMAVVESAGRWRMAPVGQMTLKLVRPEDGRELMLVRGRQLRTTEDLEVLVVGGHGRGWPLLPLEAAIESGLGPDTLVMIPWGFGKWTGQRGQLVRRAYERFADAGLRLADTGAHTGMRAVPRAMVRSEGDGFPVLAGSDPFPFRGQSRAIGRTGSVIESPGPVADWHGLLDAIRSRRGPVESFGSPLGLLEFSWMQGRMQVRKRLRSLGLRT